MEEVETAIEAMLPEFGCTLMTMPGIAIITASNILAEIGNTDRFPNAKKLAKFAGIAPINFFSGKREGHVPETGKPEITGIFLLSCNPDGAGSSQRNAEECVIS